MALATSRIVMNGETPYAHERAAINFVIEELPEGDPYHLWALLELHDPSTGRLHEIDLLVLGYNALYLVEVKSGPGRYEGDTQDWYRTAPDDGRKRWLENPYRLANLKAKVLKSRLQSKMKDGRNTPWIEPLVFLSAEDVKLAFRHHGDIGVVTRDTLRSAVQHHKFTGADERRRQRPISKPVARDVAQALAALGIKERKGKLIVGSYELGEALQDGPGYQDRPATHRDHSTWTRRARTYLVPQQTTVERRQQLIRAAERESQILWDLREHANVLSMSDYVSDAELGPTVLFDAFDAGVPLGAFLRQNPELDLWDRVAIIEQVGHALAFCHRKGVVHAALSPDAVLVRRHPETNAIETRLYNFQLSAAEKVEATTHWSALASEPWAVYQAPELREDPTQRTALSDVFSLGALAYLVFTGRAPGENAVEVDRRLAKQRCLDSLAVDDAMHPDLVELIRGATAYSPINRFDSAQFIVDHMIETLTRPDPEEPAAETSPLEVRKEEWLGNELLGNVLIVKDVLGQGATARALEVLRDVDNRYYALKVSLSPEHDERLSHEADALERLRHPRIVQLVERYSFAGRPCLLLTLAGNMTLQRHLALEGTVSLEWAARYGEDLLSALEYLEEQQVMHRDIKPANLGVGSVSRKRAHLTLFDFSLATAPKTELQVGTAAYRDPFLRVRGEWDYAAERWSAAVTLHEMLTGARPTLSGGGPLDDDARVIVATEQIDPSVRDTVTRFFERALARETENRFGSAEEMRKAWLAAFESRGVAAPADEVSEPPDERAALTDAQIAGIARDTPIEALPLSPRARNALDRAGLLKAEDLLGLADNRLSAIRGIGTLVAKEILELRDRWKAAQTEAVVDPRPFFPAYRGDDLSLSSANLEDGTAALEYAGLKSLAAVAGAPASQVKALAKRHGFDDRALHAALDAENRSADERERPSTLEGWASALLPKRLKRMKHARQLYGVDGTATETADQVQRRLDLTVRELAEREGVTTAAIYLALGKCRDQWAKHGALDELRALVHEALDGAGGALRLRHAAQRLHAALPHDRSVDEELGFAQAAALARVVAEVDKDAEHGVRYVRLHDNDAWLCASDAHTAGLKRLGDVADQLAARTTIAGPAEAARAFAEAAAETPFSTLPPERLADLGALASKSAACSARLEIYPRQMEPERALLLSASLLKSGLSPAELRRRVALRYPAARELPTRPDLDELLKPHGLTWLDGYHRYERAGASEGTQVQTRVSSLGRSPTALPSQARAMDPEAVAARQFDERLRNAVERRQLRVLGVTADRAREAAIELSRRVGVKPVAFDQLLVAAIRTQMAKGGVKREDLIHDADRGGAAGPAWTNLLKLVQAAADTVASSLLPPKEPLLLVQPGLIARYRLTGFLERLVEAAKQPEANAILLLVPSHDTGGLPAINGELAIPGLEPGQSLWVAPEWIRNRDQAPAGSALATV